MPEEAVHLKSITAINKTNKNSKTLIVASSTAVYHGEIGKGCPSDTVDTYIAVRNKISSKVSSNHLNHL